MSWAQSQEDVQKPSAAEVGERQNCAPKPTAQVAPDGSLGERRGRTLLFVFWLWTAGLQFVLA